MMEKVNAVRINTFGAHKKDTLWAEDGKVFWEHDGICGQDKLTPAKAREIAEALNGLADEAEGTDNWTRIGDRDGYCLYLSRDLEGTIWFKTERDDDPSFLRPSEWARVKTF